MILALFVLACAGTNETTFPEQYAEALCSYQDQCSRDDFLAIYYNVDDCVEEFLDDIDEDELEDCDFDKEKAKSCLEEMNDAREECDEEDLFDDDCTEVYECDGDVGFGGPNLEKSCEAYVEVANACFGGGNVSTEIDDSFCAIYDGYSGSEAADAAAFLDCLTDVLTADCAGDINRCGEG